MSGLFQYPTNTLFNKVVPKSRITANSRPTGTVREQLTDQVAQIIWKHKLFPKALNLSSTEAVPEIQIFEVVLKGDEISEGVLRLVDRAIAFPIIFELHRAEQLCVSAAYKRPSEADRMKWMVGDYFRGDWLPVDTQRAPLPMALNLGTLYREMLQVLMPHVPFPGETMDAFADRVTAIAVKERTCDKLKAAMAREKQFNRRVELNKRLRQAEAELVVLETPPDETTRRLERSL
ncbi:DUF4391 domain-containing protein [Anderseniella sp. Alg231-50]|uniref:DUF4391 domain-containing protein n=1 Tax=Anderseniella sp. Alg231-50 TaxID=1922226 RepID=UPI00307B2B31